MRDFLVTYETCICVSAENEEDAQNKVLEWNEDYFGGALDEPKIIRVISVEKGD